jgi:immune inhibitor A
VGLVQADGQLDLEDGVNRGDSGDPYPGSGANTAFTTTSRPRSLSYTGAPTDVSVTDISASGATMTASVSVSSAAPAPARTAAAPMGGRAAEMQSGSAGPWLVGTLDDLRQRLDELERTVRRYPWESVEAYLKEAHSAQSAAGADGAARFDTPRSH